MKKAGDEENLSIPESKLKIFLTLAIQKSRFTDYHCMYYQFKEIHGPDRKKFSTAVKVLNKNTKQLINSFISSDHQKQ